MRQVLFDRPFTGGVIKDQPAYKLGPRNSSAARDCIYPRGIAMNRRGWTYSGDSVIATALEGVHRTRYVLADATREVVTENTGAVHINEATPVSVAGDRSDGEHYLPRCMYRDTLILCCQDKESSALMYSGGANQHGFVLADGGVTITKTINESRVTLNLTGWDGTYTPGMFLLTAGQAQSTNFKYWIRVFSGGDAETVLEDVYWGATGTLSSSGISSTGFGFPAVEIYNAGVVTYDTSDTDLTGYGTKWTEIDDLGVASVNHDAVVVMPSSGNSYLFSTGAAEDDDTLANVEAGIGASDITTKASYRIQRAMPWGDAASHKGSLFGAVNKWYPNRVWVGPPNWNPSFPPGEVPPYSPDLAAFYSRSNPDDWKMDHVDIPAAYDGDEIVAILSSPDPLVVLKRKDAWGVYGEFPNFQRVRLPGGAGAGCLDIRSAHNLPSGAVWAGESGIYIFDGVEVRDITAGAISQYWQDLAKQYVFGSDYCTIGEYDGHLIISISYNNTSNKARLVYDLRSGTWPSDEFTNHDAKYFHTSAAQDENSKLLWVGPEVVGRVMDSSNVFSFDSGNVDDEDGTSPALQITTGGGLDGEESTDRDSRVIDVSVDAVLYDTAGTGTTIKVNLISYGGLFGENISNNLGTLTSANSTNVVRHHFHPVNQDGRVHQILLWDAVFGTNSENTRIEIPEIVLTVEDLRART